MSSPTEYLHKYNKAVKSLERMGKSHHLYKTRPNPLMTHSERVQSTRKTFLQGRVDRRAKLMSGKPEFTNKFNQPQASQRFKGVNLSPRPKTQRVKEDNLRKEKVGNLKFIKRALGLLKLGSVAGVAAKTMSASPAYGGDAEFRKMKNKSYNKGMGFK